MRERRDGHARRAERIFAALAEGGTVSLLIAEIFWAQRFCMVTDTCGTPSVGIAFFRARQRVVDRSRRMTTSISFRIALSNVVFQMAWQIPDDDTLGLSIPEIV